MGQMRGIYVAVKALIIRDGKFLIIKRSSKEDVYKNEWDLPGGKLKFGENPVNGLKREVFEETGLNIKIVKPISVWTFFKNSGKTQVIGITFLAKVISGKIRLGKEHTDFKWILPEEIDKYKIHEEIKKLIKSLKNDDSITF
jgi:8-oxo-dGTP diphosphatase